MAFDEPETTQEYTERYGLDEEPRDKIKITAAGHVAVCRCGKYRSRAHYYIGYAEGALREHQRAKGCAKGDKR